MRHPYGVDPGHPAAGLLTALLTERYGDLRDLERERITTVPTRPKRSRHYQPINRLDAARNGFTLVRAVDDYEAGNRGAA